MVIPREGLEGQGYENWASVSAVRNVPEAALSN